MRARRYRAPKKPTLAAPKRFRGLVRVGGRDKRPNDKRFLAFSEGGAEKRALQEVPGDPGGPTGVPGYTVIITAFYVLWPLQTNTLL
jgi:hypothetical protein